MTLTWRGWLLVTLFLLPWLGAFIAGLWWLWLYDWWLLWLVVVTVTTLLLWAARHWWKGLFFKLPEVTAKNQNWSPHEQAVWKQLQNRVQMVNPEHYPVDALLPDKLLHLALDLSLEVAQQYYPDTKEPRLAVPLPELIHSAERVCRDIRHGAEQVPLSHVVTAGQLLNLHDYYRRYGTQAKNILRLGSLLLNPQTHVLNELRNYLLGQTLSFSGQELLRWVLQNYTQWIVRHAIDLYSGHQQGELLPETALRFLVLGQGNSGKSSLINALFGDVTAAADILPTTGGFDCYQLECDGLPALNICDSKGYSDDLPKDLEQELDRADFVLLLCKANEAARKPDQKLVTVFQDYFQQHPEKVRPPLLILCTHIDKLSPVRKWQPPYNIVNPQQGKAKSIRAVMETLAEELPCSLNDVVPVALHQPYNIEEGVIPAILERLPAARQSQYVAHLRYAEDSAFWRKLGNQARTSGQVINAAAKVLFEQTKFHAKK